MGGVSITTRFSNVCYHTKHVLTRISPFEYAKLGLWVNQGRAGRGRDGRDVKGTKKKQEKHKNRKREDQGKKQQKKKITCY